jgi:hypothetical protein
MFMSEVSLAQAHEIAASLLGGRRVKVRRFYPPVGGDDSHSFRLWLDGRPLLLKIKQEPGSPIGLVFYERLREAGLPVPELLAFASQGGPRRQACALWSWVEGRPAHWEGGQPCPYNEAEFGALLRRIHELRLEGAPFGVLGDDLETRGTLSHPDLGPLSDRWPGFFHCERAARRYRDQGYLSPAQAAALSRLPVRLAPLFAAVEPRLLHMGDVMFHGNMIVGPDGRIAAILDYVESMAGDPRWELAWVDFYFSLYPYDRPGFDLARFRAGYGAEHDPEDEVGRFYTLAILLFEKLLFYRPETRRGAWAIATAQELIESLS